ncbi:hypothetical protein MKX41_01280 [Paenibacillus sp. FSL R5-0475]|uniref:hypothetical protein n=1 Tax=Paenibacillus sp. FSL R5-0475 TaxID=2921643 RepID=UPI0030F7FE8E
MDALKTPSRSISEPSTESTLHGPRIEELVMGAETETKMHNEQIQRKLADFYKQSVLQEWDLFKLEEKPSTNEARLEKRCRKEKFWFSTDQRMAISSLYQQQVY